MVLGARVKFKQPVKCRIIIGTEQHFQVLWEADIKALPAVAVYKAATDTGMSIAVGHIRFYVIDVKSKPHTA